MATQYNDMTLDVGKDMADEESKQLMYDLFARVSEVRTEQDRFKNLCDRADALYYADIVTQFGADIWPDDEALLIPGRSHVSVNIPATYVDVPAALQSVEPIENMVATDTTPEARSAAAAMERVYTAWKAEEEFELKFHKAVTVKGLYGRTAARVYWDGHEKRPCVEIVEQPRNLYLGYRSDQYDKLEWAAYVSRVDPNTVIEEFGVDVTIRDVDGKPTPFVVAPQGLSAETHEPNRAWLSFGNSRVEVWDYWYRKASKPLKKGRRTKMETWNVIIAGNTVVRGPVKYSEYDGELPFVPLYNTFIPGVPGGRGDLYDVEHLIREKMEKVTAGAQMIASAVAGDYWQLVGPDAPTRVPPGVKPKRNEVIAPGPGNRVESITPFVAQFQLEQFLVRIDREMATTTGLNDLLLGLAPSQVLSSSKAINALISNYEAHISLRRQMLYGWRRTVWARVVDIWTRKDERLREIVSAGGGFLDIQPPSLNPRDELETATKAANLVNAKLWAQVRGMDAVGVDDPETEQDLIREERTDATMFPADVQVMAQLLAVLQQLGLQAPEGAEAQAMAQLGAGEEALAAAGASAAPENEEGSQYGTLGVTPGEASAAEVAGGGTPPGSPFAQPTTAIGPGTATLQTLTQGGEARGRIMTQQQLGRR